MGMVGARELRRARRRRCTRRVERLAARAGVVKPRLYVLAGRLPARALRPDAAPAAARRSRSRSGCSASPRRRSSRASSRTSSRTFATATCSSRRSPSIVARRVVESSRIGGCARSARCSSCSGPLAAAFVHLLLSPKREYEADRFAAELCDSPHGLADALLRLEQAMELVAFEASPATRAALHDEPVRRARAWRRCSRRTRRSASASSGCASSTRTGARSCARPRDPERRRAPCGALRKKWAASYSPGGLLPEYHRR